jgi:hypothetical protein
MVLALGLLVKTAGIESRRGILIGKQASLKPTQKKLKMPWL